MRKPKFLVALFVAALLAPGAHAAKGNWAKVKKLKLGTLLVVKMLDRHQFKCYFSLATDDELVCQRLRNRPSTPVDAYVECHLERNRIREIRKGHTSAGEGMIEDALVGAGIGAVLATGVVPSFDRHRGRDVAILAGAGAAISVIVGHVLPVFHRGVVYKR